MSNSLKSSVFPNRLPNDFPQTGCPNPKEASRRPLRSQYELMDDTPQLNLRVLKRHHPGITSVIDKSSYCVIYTFSTVTSSWTKAGYEGTLFIYSQQPHMIQTEHGEQQGGGYGFCVLNRLSLDNFWGEINGGDIVLDDQYIITRSLTGGEPTIKFNNRRIRIMAL